jgi:hypothetical protein
LIKNWKFMGKDKNTTALTDAKKRKLEERQLLDSWHPYIKSAMEQVHKKFLSDTKFILTESDLKCWLFYYLQHDNKIINDNKGKSLESEKDLLYSVHTEVTHYAQHLEEKKENDILIVKLEEKHKFRDLSLLCPWEIRANLELLKQVKTKKELLSKGFSHKAPAIHFELKFIREIGANYEVSGLKADIKKFSEYHSDNDRHIRDFVIVCGSRARGTNVADLINAIKADLNNPNLLKERLRIYLFDNKDLVYMKWDESTWVSETLTIPPKKKLGKPQKSK